MKELSHIPGGTVLDKISLTLVAAGSGIVLYEGLFPSFYYMTWLGYLMLLWAFFAFTSLIQIIVSLAVAKWKKWPITLPAGLGFTFGWLLLVTLLIGFKIPLHASFLLAKPGLEEALAQHHDDLTKIGVVSHNYGLYQFRKADRRCHRKDRVFFQFSNDGEAAIIHSTSGIDDLCYNSGNKGHLFGDWYWMKED
ncbi:MAG: hypothetical protein AAF514_15460 [Verrucomicrobiota bacterium]